MAAIASSEKLCDVARAVQKLRTDLEDATDRLREYNRVARELDALLNPDHAPAVPAKQGIRHFSCFMCAKPYGVLGAEGPPSACTALCGHTGFGKYCHSEENNLDLHTDQRCDIQPGLNECYACRRKKWSK